MRVGYISRQVRTKSIVHTHSLTHTHTVMYSPYSRVVILTDLSNGYQSLGVLVWPVWVDVVQRRWIGRVTVASSKVHAHREVDLTAAHDVIQERVLLHYCL